MVVSVQLPEFTPTPVDVIAAKAERVRKAFSSQTTRCVQFRINQLRRLYWMIEDHRDELIEACRRDLNKPLFETMVTEINWVQNSIVFATQNLIRWSKDEAASDISWANSFMRPRIRKEPLGAVLVIGAFNFPLMLSLEPMVGAIAAGNTVVLKPSENAPHSAAVIQRVIDKSLDLEYYAVVQGGIPETTALLAKKWDKIFFTGSANTGRIIAQAAARTLTPLTLELGGRNPAIVTSRANARLAARRLLWAKVTNAGQVCLSQNYILVERGILAAFIEELKLALREFFPDGAQQSQDFGRIVNTTSFRRIKNMLDSTSGEIVAGGTLDAEDLYIEPTIVQVGDSKDPLIIQESFGPIIPILPVDDLDEAIQVAIDTHETPLAVYAFGSNEETTKVLNSTRSGGASINDGFFHGVVPTLPFGGVGDSGEGAYRGKASFDCFTHRRSVTNTPSWMETLLAFRYPPFNGTNKLRRFNRMSQLAPDFDRNGRSLGWWGALGAANMVVLATTVAVFFVAVAMLL